MYIILIDFQDVDPTLNSWDKSHLVMVCNPFYVAGWFADFLGVVSASVFTRELFSVVLFSCDVFGL